MVENHLQCMFIQLCTGCRYNICWKEKEERKKKER